MTYYCIIDSPIGELTIGTNGKAITSLHIEGDKYFTSIPSNWQQDLKQPLLIRAKNELQEYFARKRQQFEVPLSIEGTDFQKQVWAAVTTIPYGTTISYRELAANIGKPRAVRAVGNAIGRNQICIIVPCHRVVASDNSIGGFVAGEACKQKLLTLEAPENNSYPLLKDQQHDN